MKITIKDIAQQAEVSVSAVSLALNDKPGVSRETKERILAIAQEMGYEFTARDTSGAEAVVRLLKIQRHGHTINASHNIFIDDYIDGINSIASRSGITLEIATYHTDTSIEEIAEIMGRNTQTKGYLILGTELSASDVTTLIETGKDIVFMDTFIDYIPADFVDMNNTDAVYKIVTYLVGHGHTEIGLITSSVPTRNFYLREQAFYQVIEHLRLPYMDQYIVDVDSTFNGAYEDMKRYLEGTPTLPSAYFVINDIVALGCMKALQEAGYAIPDDISLIAFDNLPMATMVFPALTSIDVSKRKIGQNALTILLSKSEHNESAPPIKMLIGGELVERDSVRTLEKAKQMTPSECSF